MNEVRIPSSGPTDDAILRSWLEGARTSYRAPGYARATGLPADSVDCATNTATLEHIPVEDIAQIFAEMFRVLKREEP